MLVMKNYSKSANFLHSYQIYEHIYFTAISQ